MLGVDISNSTLGVEERREIGKRERETGKEAEEGRERGGERTNFQFIFSHKRPSHPPTPAPDHPRKKKKHPQFMNKYTVPVN